MSEPSAFIGIDLGKTSMRGRRYLFVDSSNAASACVEAGEPVSQPTPQTSSEAIVAACSAMIHALTGSEPAARAVGVGSFGIVDPRAGRVVKSGTLPFWNNVDLAEGLAQSCGLPCFVMNDVAAAVAAIGYHRAHDKGPFALIQLGTSVGVSGAGGHLDELWPLPDFGQVARLTDMSGVELKTQLGGRWLTEYGSQALSTSVSPSDLFSLAKSGDQTARSVVDRYISRLAELCATLAALLVPDEILLGGGMAPGLAPFYAELDDAYRSRVRHLWHTPLLKIIDDGGEPQLGAAIWAKTRYEQSRHDR